MVSRPAAGGGVWVEVGPDRFARWCDGFAQRHGGLSREPRLVADEVSGRRPHSHSPQHQRASSTDVSAGDDEGRAGDAETVGAVGAVGAVEGVEAVELAVVDGSVATCHVPFPPLVAGSGGVIDRLIAHALAERTVGVLLVRRGGFAVGVFEGTRLVESKVGARHVQGRTKAGGWSQQRFARRREGQAREAYAAAADTAARILLPRAADLDALIVGGDAGAISTLRTDVRLKPLWPKQAEPFLNVGDPKVADLQKAPEAFTAVRIRLVEQN